MLKQLQSEKLQVSLHRHRKVVVLGSPRTNASILLGVARQYGLSKEQFEFCLGYDKAKTFQYKKLRNQDKYAAIIVGPIPHSTRGTGSYSSVIAAMESEEDYPPVFRVEKITNSSFRNVISQMIIKKVIAA